MELVELSGRILKPGSVRSMPSLLDSARKRWLHLLHRVYPGKVWCVAIPRYGFKVWIHRVQGLGL